MVKVEFTGNSLQEVIGTMRAFLAEAPLAPATEAPPVPATEAPPAAPPAPTPAAGIPPVTLVDEPPALPGEIDSKGVAFNPAFHSGKKTASGAWRKKRGAPPAAVHQVVPPAVPQAVPPAVPPAAVPQAVPQAVPPVAGSPGTLLFHELASLAAVVTNLGLEAVVSSALRGNPIETVLGNVEEIQRVGGNIVRALVAEQKWDVAADQLGADKATALYSNGL